MFIICSIIKGKKPFEHLPAEVLKLFRPHLPLCGMGVKRAEFQPIISAFIALASTCLTNGIASIAQTLETRSMIERAVRTGHLRFPFVSRFGCQEIFFRRPRHNQFRESKDVEIGVEPSLIFSVL